MMEIVKRDGSLETVKFEKILEAVNRACRGLEGVEAVEIAKRTISGLHRGSSTKELDELSISNAVMLMVEEPNYSKVAARMLAESINKEVGRSKVFRDYISEAFELGLLNATTHTLAQEDFNKIEFAIRHERDDLFEYFGLKTVADRYLLRHPTSRKIIERPQWLFMRVSLGLSKTVDEAISLYEVVSQFLYMPSTPTLFNSGTRHPQMSSCYLLTVSEDSLEGIYKSITDCAKLSKFSGGIGIDWTSIRASGALIKGTNGLSNGVIPFLKVFDSSVHAINQGGKRKGAAAVYMEPWHGDIESFLELRQNTGSDERRTHNLNLALWVPDLFMKRVEADQEWSLFSPNDVPELLKTFGKAFDEHYLAYEAAGKAMKKVSARTLYAKMVSCLAETGNGWLCFKDQSNLRSAQTARSENIIRSSNLCTEILEVANKNETAVCNLGSVNLAAYVQTGANGKPQFDFEKLKTVVRTAVKFLDRVVDINFYPTKEASSSNNKWRPVGLGIMGLQDVFFKMKLAFTSPEAQKLSSMISEIIYFEAITSSMLLAKEEGSFTAFADSRYADGELQVQLARKHQESLPELHLDWEGLAHDVKKNGIRNSLLIAIAPTATIASIVGSFESIEPQISNFFKRETLSGEFLQVNRYLINELKSRGLWNPTIRSKIVQAEGSVQNLAELPEDIRKVYQTTWEISQKDLIDMAAHRSTFVCQSQSLNLFMESPTIGKLSSMYMYAWKKGIKTTYYLRSRAKTAISKTTLQNEPAGATSGGAIPGAGAAFSADEAITCSLDNPESCEACQ